MRSSGLLGSLTAVLSGAAVVVACSSKASGTGAPFTGSSGGSGTSGTSSGASSGTSGEVDSGPPPVTCNAAPPRIFPPVAGTGPYCDTAHCAFGQQCCFDAGAATIACASSCTPGVIAIACYNGSECPSGQQCCFNATADTTACTYLTIRGNTGSVCATSCNGSQVVACATSDECDGKTCTPAYFLKSNQTETATAQGGFCL